MTEQLTLVGTNSKYYGQIKNPPGGKPVLDFLQASKTKVTVNGKHIREVKEVKPGDLVKMNDAQFHVAALHSDHYKLLALSGKHTGKTIPLPTSETPLRIRDTESADHSVRLTHDQSGAVYVTLEKGTVTITRNGQKETTLRDKQKYDVRPNDHVISIGKTDYLLLPKIEPTKNPASKKSSASPIPIRPEDILHGPPPLPARASQTSASVIIADGYMDSLKQHGAKIERVNLFELIRDNAAMFMFGRKDKDLQDYHTIFHHFGKNVKQNSEVKPERMGSDLHAKIRDVIKIHDRSRLEDPRRNTHVVQFTLPALDSAGHSIVSINYTTDAKDPFNREINATLGIILPHALADGLVRKLKTKPAETLEEIYDKIVKPANKTALPKPAITGTRLRYFTPTTKETVIESIP